MQKLLVTDDPAAWAFLREETTVVLASSYLADQVNYKSKSIHVTNLCHSYEYQSIGYYVSLLAEARLHQITPGPIQIQDILSIYLSDSISLELDEKIQQHLKGIKRSRFMMNVYFGKCKHSKYWALNQALYSFFQMPLFKIIFVKEASWVIKTLRPLSIQDVPMSDQLFMQASAHAYFKQNSVEPLFIKKSAYTLAILVEPNDATPPSNKKSIEQFVNAGEKLGLNIDIITQKDEQRMSEYDALFIRATTSVNHYTYQMARCAERKRLIVMDDPLSILKCGNKIFLAELFNKNNILTPYTQFINKHEMDFTQITFPCVIKKPDGSCSQGVVKIDDLASLKQTLTDFFKTSDMVLMQPFIPTEFDWRIGIIDNKPLYACRYYMAKNHWQVVNWECDIEDDILIHDTVFIDEVPIDVIQVALKATKLIGRGLYGVDIKSIDNKHYVIEVNDNPSINFGIEDKLLQHTLYEKIMQVFVQRLAMRVDTKCQHVF